MERLAPSETILTGSWIFENGRMRGDDVKMRIKRLLATHLRELGHDWSGWYTLYRDPADARLWEHTYPQSQMHGGGPPQLRFISDEDATDKYGYVAKRRTGEFEASALACVAAAIALATTIAIVPRRVSYVERIDIDAPADLVFDNIRLQERFVRWSAWPEVIKATCAVKGIDGTEGARTRYYSASGASIGWHEIVAIWSPNTILFTLRSPGSIPQRPRLRFDVADRGPNRSSVALEFTNYIARPFNVLMQIAGIVRWTRGMHRRDLAGLKSFSEARDS